MARPLRVPTATTATRTTLAAADLAYHASHAIHLTATRNLCAAMSWWCRLLHWICMHAHHHRLSSNVCIIGVTCVEGGGHKVYLMSMRNAFVYYTNICVHIYLNGTGLRICGLDSISSYSNYYVYSKPHIQRRHWGRYIRVWCNLLQQLNPFVFWRPAR